MSVIRERSLAKTKHRWGKERRLTLRLLLVRSDGAYEVLGRHVNLSISMLTNDLQCGKVAENLVWSWVGPYPVLILHHLPTRQGVQLMTVISHIRHEHHSDIPKHRQDQRTSNIQILCEAREVISGSIKRVQKGGEGVTRIKRRWQQENKQLVARDINHPESTST